MYSNPPLLTLLCVVKEVSYCLRVSSETVHGRPRADKQSRMATIQVQSCSLFRTKNTFTKMFFQCNSIDSRVTKPPRSSPFIFTYCKPSKPEWWEGLPIRLRVVSARPLKFCFMMVRKKKTLRAKGMKSFREKQVSTSGCYIHCVIE